MKSVYSCRDFLVFPCFRGPWKIAIHVFLATERWGQLVWEKFLPLIISRDGGKSIDHVGNLNNTPTMTGDALYMFISIYGDFGNGLLLDLPHCRCSIQPKSKNATSFWQLEEVFLWIIVEHMSHMSCVHGDSTNPPISVTPHFNWWNTSIP